MLDARELEAEWVRAGAGRHDAVGHVAAVDDGRVRAGYCYYCKVVGLTQAALRWGTARDPPRARGPIFKAKYNIRTDVDTMRGCGYRTFTGGPKVPASTRTALSETSLYAKQSLHMY